MTKQQYRDARALIADPEHWIKRVMLRGTTQYCAFGACLVTEGMYDGANSTFLMSGNLKERYPELTTAAAEQGWGSPATLNDDGTHAQVIRMFDRAIALAKE